MQTTSKNTRESMYPVIKQFMSTDVSQRKFCEVNQIGFHCFQYWLKKYRKEMNSHDSYGEPSFSSIEIELPTTERHILIRTKAGVEIEIPV